MTNEAATNDRRIAHARVDWDEGAPHSTVFGDIYFSGDGPAETAHVFLEGTDMPRRFEQAERFSIGELGFGSGLNFLMAWELWRRTPKPERARLHFFSVEAFPLRPEDMARAHAAWPRLKALSARLRALSPPAAAGTHSLPIAPDVTLTLAYGDAQAALARAEGVVDAWFFDGFSPAKTPEMWRAGLFAEAARLSNPGATFATFTVAGDVRRAIAAAGFAAEKRPGYGRKKEMLAGRIDAPVKRSPRAPWFMNANPQRLARGARVAIIGGGVAGASLAYAARRGGLDPVIIEADAPAAGASGNPAGLIMPRLDLGDTPAARFFLLAYVHAVRLLSDLDQPGIFSSCGVLLGAEKVEQQERLARVAAAGLLPEDWLRQAEDVLLLPQAGVVDPAAFVRALIAATPVIKARVSIPARNLAVDVLFRKNGDAALPASHLVEVNFSVTESFLGGGIASLPGILLKDQELAQGDPLVGASARIFDNSFLFALSAAEADLAKNLDLIASRGWIDLPVVYSTGRKAIVTMEKGKEGGAIFEAVLAAWAAE